MLTRIGAMSASPPSDPHPRVHGHDVMAMMLEAGRPFGHDELVAVVIDRFGPSARFHKCSAQDLTAAEIVDFLLSCRVLGRNVEDGILRHVIAEWRREGGRRARGRIGFTPKNVPARRLFSGNGFRSVRQDERESLWEAEVSEVEEESPS